MTSKTEFEEFVDKEIKKATFDKAVAECKVIQSDLYIKCLAEIKEKMKKFDE